MSEKDQSSAIVTENFSDQNVMKALLMFVGLAALISLPFYYFMINIGLKRLYMVGLMFAPALAAYITCKQMGVSLNALGFRWGNVRYNWLAYFIPVAYGLVAYGIIWAFGLGSLIDNRFLKDAAFFLGDAGWSTGITIIFAVFMLATYGAIWHFMTAMGEEIGWRGLLSPLLMRKFNFPVAALITGLIWAAWHLPLILYTKYNAGPVDLWMQVLNYTEMCVGLSFIMLYLRLQAGNVWAPTILHGAHNVYLLSIFGPMTIKYEETWKYAGEFGVVLPITILVFGLYFWRRAVAEGLEGPLKS